MGRRRSRTRVEYSIPSEVSDLQRAIVEELHALRPLAEQVVPEVQQAIQQFINQYQNWLQQSSGFFREAERQIGNITRETIQDLTRLYFGNPRRERNLFRREGGLFGLLNQYIRQTERRVGKVWDKTIGRASAYWNKASRRADKYWTEALKETSSYWDETLRGADKYWAEALKEASSYWDETLRGASGYWDEARQTLLRDIQEAEQKIPSYYERARAQTRELTQQVLQDALRNTIRRMALQGFISQTAGAQAMAEQFRQYEYEPLQRLIETEAEAMRRLQEQALGYKADISEKKAGILSGMAKQRAETLSGFAGQRAKTLTDITEQKARVLSGFTGQRAQDISSLISQGLKAVETFLRDYASNITQAQHTSMALRSGLAQQQLDFQLALPKVYREIMHTQQQHALTPFELRRALLGTLTGTAGVVQQLSPAHVTYTTRGGVNPLLGTTLGVIGSLGLGALFKRFPFRLK